MHKVSVKSQPIEVIEKRTFLLHMISQFFNGIALGIGLLQDVILKKSLEGSDFQILLLSFLVCSAFLVSIYGAEIINRSANRSSTIIKLGLASKTSFLLIPLFDTPLFFIICIAVSAYIDSMLLSSWNIVFKHNYREERRSRLYSYATSLQTIMILVSSTIFGYFLDKNNYFYKFCFPAAGILGMLTYYNLAKMIGLSMDDHKTGDKIPKAKYSLKLLKDIILLPVRNTIRIFRTNRAYFRFESYFFLYGMAFMVISPAIPIYLVDFIKMDYTEISLARGFIFHSALILFTPLMGKHHGHGNPTRFCGIVFLIIVLYPLLLIAANNAGDWGFISSGAILVYVASFIFGIGMSGVIIAWALSSIYYAPQYQESNYQAIHIALTGLRGVFSPALGYAVMKLFAIEYTFILSALLFFSGGLLMLRESKIKKRSEASSAPERGKV